MMDHVKNINGSSIDAIGIATALCVLFCMTQKLKKVIIAEWKLNLQFKKIYRFTLKLKHFGYQSILNVGVMWKKFTALRLIQVGMETATFV